MKQRHHCQQTIVFGETKPLADLARVGDQVAVGEQAALWFSGSARSVDDDGLIVAAKGSPRRFSRLKLPGAFNGVVEGYY